MKKNNSVLLSTPYILWMLAFTLIPLGVVAYYAFTDPNTGAFSMSNILDGVMLADYKVKFFGRTFKCLDAGFAPNEPVDVVIRPEDIDFVPVEEGHLTGTVTSVTFKGLNYDIIVDFKGFKWLIQTTDFQPVGAEVGIRLNPEDIHIMHKSEYSGMFGDYSSYSSEYDELMEDADDEEE